MKTIEFRKHFGYDVQQASDATAIFNDEPSLTVQSDAIDADINVLMKRYGVTGKLPENPRVPMYGDFTDIVDYRSALEAVMLADERFFLLPANVRARFENNPQNLLEFVENPANLKEAQSLGLLKEKADGGSTGKPVQQTGTDAGTAPGAAAPGGPGHGSPAGSS